MGSLVESVGLARMALRFVPTEEVLKPILPIMPALFCSRLIRTLRGSGSYLGDHINRRLPRLLNGHNHAVTLHSCCPVPVLRQ